MIMNEMIHTNEARATKAKNIRMIIPIRFALCCYVRRICGCPSRSSIEANDVRTAHPTDLHGEKTGETCKVAAPHP